MRHVRLVAEANLLIAIARDRDASIPVWWVKVGGDQRRIARPRPDDCMVIVGRRGPRANDLRLRRTSHCELPRIGKRDRRWLALDPPHWWKRRRAGKVSDWFTVEERNRVS